MHIHPHIQINQILAPPKALLFGRQQITHFPTWRTLGVIDVHQELLAAAESKAQLGGEFFVREIPT